MFVVPDIPDMSRDVTGCCLLLDIRQYFSTCLQTSAIYLRPASETEFQGGCCTRANSLPLATPSDDGHEIRPWLLSRVCQWNCYRRVVFVCFLAAPSGKSLCRRGRQPFGCLFACFFVETAHWIYECTWRLQNCEMGYLCNALSA